MKTTESQKHETGGAEEQDVAIDTSKMNAGQRAALELTEAARDATTLAGSFGQSLFMGRCELERMLPFPQPTHEDVDQGDAFLHRLEKFLRDKVDPDEIDRSGEIPDEVIRGLGDMGAMAIKIHPQYGGLGLSQTNYCRAAMLLGSHCGSLTALVSAHQSIGVPQPLILFGTEEQKRRFLPRFGKGEISAFALTEAGVGSDPAAMTTGAEPTADGKHFIINGEKLWCTNGTKAGVIVVMARTPDKMVNGRARKQITAFIVDMDTPGVEVVRRCRFMGLKALYNGVIRFTNVKVPAENIIAGEGRGLKVALSTLNTGRLTLPAACTGLAKKCLQAVRKWSAERVQWGAPVGRHAAVADKLAKIAAKIFAMESMTLYTASLVDRDKQADIRLEAAMCKMWGTEKAWEIVDETMQIRGGRGYETAQSLKERGEEPVAVERWMRDCRINMIFEGSSEIMRLFIAREALDPHLKVAAAALDTRLPITRRAVAAGKAGLFYAGWYPRQWLAFLDGGLPRVEGDIDPILARHLRFAKRATRKLSRSLFHAMAFYGPKLERQQILLGRFVEIGTEIFAIAATCARAQSMLGHANRDPKVLSLTDCFARDSRLKIKELFRSLHSNNDKANYRVAQEILNGDNEWLERGIM
ncbi:MAG: acyl-CoA dehydrogenase family protein [Verrucomicrobiae bacterium]|nr:acyl-CoA dehydrogenase family protein [Verrucomicrobiae bacterium]